MTFTLQFCIYSQSRSFELHAQVVWKSTVTFKHVINNILDYPLVTVPVAWNIPHIIVKCSYSALASQENIPRYATIKITGQTMAYGPFYVSLSSGTWVSRYREWLTDELTEDSGQCKYFIPSPKRQDCLWDSNTFLLNGTRDFIFGGKAAGELSSPLT